MGRNKNVTLVNALPLCDGSITRKRITKCLNEKSILDLFMVCNQVLPYVVRMHVDEMGEHQLTNFYGIRHKGKVTETDHAKVEMDVSLQFEAQKPSRKEASILKALSVRNILKN